MKRSIHVNLDERSYDIHIGDDLHFELFDESWRGRRTLLVSDSNVDPLHGDACAAALEEAGLVVSRMVVPAGEGTKSLASVATLYDAAITAGLDRKSSMVALGGGMVGDLTGFAAASYLRGIGLIQVPTSLLAMVDSSVGGKTGVNLSQGKNLVGAFYQPKEVAINLAALDTLPEREYVSGLAEVVKYGVIWDAEFFALLEREAAALLARDREVLANVVGRCCEIKAEVVRIDEQESGVRAILNFGHTLGHAIEQAAGYGVWLHGEAVGLGMVYAAEVSVREREFPAIDAARLRTLLLRLGLPVSVSERSPELTWDTLREVMVADKKTRDGCLRFVLARRLGDVVYDCEIADDVLKQVYRDSFGGAEPQ